MIKAIYFVHRQPQWEWDAFVRYWLEVHAPIAARTPGLRRYVVVPATSPDGPLAGVAEMWFDDEEAFRAGRASPEHRAAVEDAAKFLDIERLTYILAQEHVIIA